MTKSKSQKFFIDQNCFPQTIAVVTARAKPIGIEVVVGDLQLIANLKEDTRHIYKKRVFFIDEDSWQIAVTDIYDNRDQLYRVGVAHGLNYYELPAQWSTLEVFHDLESRRYIAIGLDYQANMYDFSTQLEEKSFTPAALRREGRR